MRELRVATIEVNDGDHHLVLDFVIGSRRNDSFQNVIRAIRELTHGETD